MKTIEEIFLAQVKKCENKTQMYAVSDLLVLDIINSDPRVLSCDRRHANGYCTWRISIFANEYHFGKELGAILNSINITTHDEDKDFTPEDLREDIDEKVTEWLADKWENQ
ncbi:MAG: hypothetical protein IIY78_01895 [Clostridia bacterium]|nr:hypothetical protein [Clostridia bacterium]MBQ2452727.1 hypothetical protein [Bacteroidales bacterium]MBR0335110.1 hypothetical protein [Bacteroidales bacterium]